MYQIFRNGKERRKKEMEGGRKGRREESKNIFPSLCTYCSYFLERLTQPPTHTSFHTLPGKLL
jgi:hypothetical protein